MNNDDPRNLFYQQRTQFSQGEAKHQQQSQQQTPPTQQHQQQTPQQTSQQQYQDKVEQMKKLAEKYQREGEGQLVKDIVNSVIEQKAAGTLSNQQLQAFAKRISPLLNSQQRTRLDELVQQLLQL